MNRGANRGRGSSPMYKTCYYNTSPNPNFFANFPQEYNPDFINAQREFLLGNAGVLPLNTPPWNNYRVPQRPHPKTIASHPTPRFSHPPLPPHRRYQGPPRRELEGLSHQFQSLNVSQEPLENKLLSFFRGQREGEGLSAKRLVKSFHIEKKAINRCLYNLQKKGLLQKEEGSPPYWSITTSASQPKPSPSRSCQEEQGLVWPRNQRVIPSTHSHYPEEEPCTSSSLLLPAQSSSRNYIKEAPSEGKGDCSASHLVANSPDVMAENREKVCEYLFNSPGSTVNNIKKNTGITKPSEINQILSTLDKEGSVLKVNANPAKWSLTDKKRERMVIKKRANEIQEMESQVEDLENLVPSEEETEEVVQSMENGQQTANIKEEEVDVKPIIVDKTHVAAPPLSNKLTKEVADEAAVELAIETADEPPRKRAKAMEIADYDDEKFTMDEVPGANEEFVQGSESSKELSLLEKLQACQKKNPVSGFLEFAQYCGSHCELTLLEQSGPSHDPRFKIQAVLGNRRFPIAEASNKKVARKDAAAMALRILMHEEQGGTEEEVLETVAKTTVASKAELPTAPQLTLQSSKNPISILMEHGQRSGSMCEFKLVSQKGPPHDPKFTYEVKIGNQTFPAVVANSKKLAKQQAAEAAVKLLLGQSALQGQKFNKGSNADITESTTVRGFSEDDIKMASASGMRDLIKYLNANPVSGLLEYSRAKGFAAEFIPVSQSGPPHDPKFVYQAKVGGRYFPPVSASNKKQAKAEAADAALRVLIGEAEKSVGPMQSDIEVPLSVNTFHDQIAMLSHQKFNSLTARIQNSLLGRKILAAIIMKKDQDDVGTVVSIGTGNRCVKGEELSLRGETVNDCHAEIISRRGFIRYLYSELMKFNPSMPDDSIFEETETELLRVKNGVTFHLYISTAPCGDGALFDKSCSDQPNVDGDKRHYPIFENPKQGKLRTKVENGEGTIPVESSDIVPTWDGIQHGERLRTMSCSDKILRWNVLGLQGGILTHFIEPVYLSTVTLGYLFSKGHLTRAICCRMSRKECVLEAQLQDPYFINHPEVGRVSVYDSTRQTGKTKESSVNWCLADNEVEVLDGTKGKVDGPQLEVSRLSKVHMFILFQELSKCRQSSFQSFNSYNEVKEAATSYQTAKGQFVQALQHMGYGNWINKPQEEKSFCVV